MKIMLSLNTEIGTF